MLSFSLSFLRCTHHRNLSTSPSTSLRHLIKPFLLKCHPDTLQQQDSKNINLSAIQNLNAYLDAVHSLLLDTKGVQNQPRVFVVDFVITLPQSSQPYSKKQAIEEEPFRSRRKVELVLPPKELYREKQIHQHASRQLLRLLQMAGLKGRDCAPSATQGEEERVSTSDEDLWSATMGQSPPSDEDLYHDNRERFVKNINWSRYDELYEQAMADLKADFATEGSLAKDLSLRQKTIADVLARVRWKYSSVAMMDQLVAIRRLSLLLDEHFDELQLEEWGRLWEHVVLILGPARAKSFSALQKQRLRGVDVGYAFTLQRDGILTIEVPMDFDDDELIRELQRNIGDIYDLYSVDRGFESIFGIG